MAGYERTLECLQQWLRPTNRALEFGCSAGTTALHLAPLVVGHLYCRDREGEWTKRKFSSVVGD
jgi:predicted O-methyltransferase YrrM